MVRRWNPWHERRIDRIFDDYPISPWTEWTRPYFYEPKIEGFRNPLIEGYESDKEININVELPGIEKKDIILSIEGDGLSVKVDKKKEESKGGEKYSYSKSFFTHIPLPLSADKDNIKATYKDGMLKITVPKSGTGKSIDIE